jgi:hypothetical protein
LKNLVEKFHLAPDVIYEIDNQTIADWITISNYQDFIAEQNQKGPPPGA